MVRTARTMTLVVVGIALVRSGSVCGGECIDPNGHCTEPCRAENSCYWDGNCAEGMWCVPSCLPSECWCASDGQGGGVWGCTADCAGECVDRPVWTGPPSYVIIGLGTLGGWTSVALAVNDCGQVVGGADTREGWRHGFLWDAGEMIDLGTLPGIKHSEAWDVNNNAQAVGIALAYSGGPERAFLWEDGKMIDLGDLGHGFADANAINDAGQVVGDPAFLWEDGVMTDLYATVGLLSPRDINNLGHVAGAVPIPGGGHAGLWDGQTLIDLGTLGGERSGSAAINDLGQVVGYSERPPGGDRIVHAFLWDNAEMIDLGAIGGFERSRAYAINDAGQIILAGWKPEDFGVTYLYDPQRGMQALTSLLAPENGRYILMPRDINDAGQIVGQGFRGGGAFLMTPLNGDFDGDQDTDLVDFAAFCSCMTGPGAPVEAKCKQYDIDRDGQIDLVDFRAFEWVFTASQGGQR